MYPVVLFIGVSGPFVVGDVVLIHSRVRAINGKIGSVLSVDTKNKRCNVLPAGEDKPTNLSWSALERRQQQAAPSIFQAAVAARKSEEAQQAQAAVAKRKAAEA